MNLPKIVNFLIEKQEKILVYKTKYGDYTLPGGKTKLGEINIGDVQKNLSTQGINIELCDFLGVEIADFEHEEYLRQVFVGKMSENAKLNENYVWINISELENYDFTRGITPFFKNLKCN